MLEVLFRLFVAAGLMVGSAQVPQFLAQPGTGILSHARDEAHPMPLRGAAVKTDVA